LNLPKVSVITGNKDGGNFLHDCIKSVLNQSYKNIEHVIVDAGSTGDDTKIIEDYKNKYPDRIRLIVAPNVTVADGMNIGLENSSGDFIAGIDSDDCFEQDGIESLENFLISHEEYSAVCGWYRQFNDANFPRKGFPLDYNFEGRIEKINKEKVFKGLWGSDSCIETACMLIRRKVYEEIRWRDFGYASDFDFRMRLLEKYDIAIIRKFIVVERLSSKQITSRLSKENKDSSTELVVEIGNKRRKEAGIT
jgi:glycosyltransferase involved in cell wall biosynthesis